MNKAGQSPKDKKAPVQLAGRVKAVHGSVVDVTFPEGQLPAINDAIAIDFGEGRQLMAEVHQHLGPVTVRAVALENTAGLKRGVGVRALGAPISVPVGEGVLGRLLNAIGEVADRGEPLPVDTPYRPIHVPPPAMDRLDSSLEIFHTGIKVIDLLAPLV